MLIPTGDTQQRLEGMKAGLELLGADANQETNQRIEQIRKVKGLAPLTKEEHRETWI